MICLRIFVTILWDFVKRYCYGSAHTQYKYLYPLVWNVLWGTHCTTLTLTERTVHSEIYRQNFKTGKSYYSVIKWDPRSSLVNFKGVECQASQKVSLDKSQIIFNFIVIFNFFFIVIQIPNLKPVWQCFKFWVTLLLCCEFMILLKQNSHTLILNLVHVPIWRIKWFV